MARYLIPEPTHNVRLEQLQAKHKALMQQAATLLEENTRFRKEGKQRQSNLDGNAKALKKLRADYDQLKAGSAEYLDLKEKYQKVNRKLAEQTNNLRSVLSDQKKKADRNEDDLIEEIEALEGKLNENLARQNTQVAEIEELRDTIKGYEKDRSKGDRQKIKATGVVKKRFNTLYKNILIHDRAISGFVGLNEELKIKAEEVIHQLNENPTIVPIKRKVFGGKKHKTVFEVIFAYKGRFYFRNSKDQRVEVLAIGTKNTQAKELEFLARL